MDEKTLKKKAQLRKRIMDTETELDDLMEQVVIERRQQIVDNMDELNAKFVSMNDFINEFVVLSELRSELIHTARTNLLDAQRALQDALLHGS